MNLADLLVEGKAVIVDGAMGTLLQAQGLARGECPEGWNLLYPERVQAVHAAYLAAGAQIIETNTFGANRVKLAAYGLAAKVREINAAGVRLAREAAGGRALAAASIGPTGRLFAPWGDLTFEEAYAVFAEQAEACAAAGADILWVETMGELGEARAALLAARETGLPVVVTLTFSNGARTLTGTDPVTAAVVLTHLGAAAVGANCSGGAQELWPVLAEMARATALPLVVQPNAGLPRPEGGQSVFPVGPEEFAAWGKRFLDLGVALLGGCCGTTPAHIAALTAAVKGRAVPARSVIPGAALSSRSRTVFVGSGCPPLLIGERINPTGKKALATALKARAWDEVVALGRSQEEEGAGALDVNVGLPGGPEPELLRDAVRALGAQLGSPLVLDSANPQALAAALPEYPGRALINSVSGRPESLAAVLPLAKKYGAAVVALTLNEQGIPPRAEERVAVARRIVAAAEQAGLARQDVLVDCLTLTAGAAEAGPRETLRAVRLAKDLGLSTLLGVSNVSHGLPGRETLNSTFLAMALAAGLDAVIADPASTRIKETLLAGAALTGRDPGAKRYIETVAGKAPAAPKGGEVAREGEVNRSKGANLGQALRRGEKDALVRGVQEELAAGRDPLELLNTDLLPALGQVGEMYARGEYFLPQLLLSAEAMEAALGLLERAIGTAGVARAGRVALATVAGDIHDIGKNIVAALLRANGFQVVDLGRDVPPEEVVAAVAGGVDAVGLSALMTTTLPSLEQTVQAVKRAAPHLPVMVGGAVVTEEYARSIGADGYAADGVGAVALARQLIARAQQSKEVETDAHA
ncbi:homocysteine S-methyltransferase family protein [Gelria sp. Kuro-4]|uniref:homocysteine S-methyltransferase family protein n=1 Tax=Gelria sp. Kuro-4 TaxID=2796927 RepID=UPI001BED90E4|nr:homocysteine S-methyltransferase family protein [Gelria sp. Kuro-4]BCV24528.1 5-methyltetrahydrofolate--homocysteine methyltransferase [Gelria sp. Kuro-4]